MIKQILPVAFAGCLLLFNTGCKNEGSFKNLGGIKYKIVKDVEGKKIMNGDIVEYHILAKCDTTVLSDSRKMNSDKPAVIQAGESQGKTDWRAVFPFLSKGDSAVLEVSCDTILKYDVPANMQSQLPPWLKKGNKIIVQIAIVEVKTRDQFENEQKQKAAQQAQVDDKLLQEYFAKNNLKPTKTASGLYYSITKEGTGANIEKGQTVTMNYTGKTLDGNTFDSNTDSNFHHVEPFTFMVGIGQVVPGWDEGVQLLKKGSKAMLFLPSTLAYGERSPDPKLPANSVLTFEVEVTDVKAAPAGNNQMRAMPQGNPADAPATK